MTPPTNQGRACRTCALVAGWKPNGAVGTALLCACRLCGKVGPHLSDHDYEFVFDATKRETSGRANK